MWDGVRSNRADSPRHGNGSCANLSNASPRRLWVISAGIFFQSWCLWIYLFDSNRHPAFLLLLGLWLLPLLFLLSRRWSNQRPGLVQIYLSPHGCLQLDDLTEPAAIRVVRLLTLPILGIIGFAWVLIATDGDTRAFLIGAFAIATIVIACYAWGQIKQPTTPKRRITPAEAIAVSGHRWNGNETIDFENAHQGYIRLRIRPAVRWYQLQTEIVDAELQYDLERSLQIRQIIRERNPIATAIANDENTTPA